MQLAGRAAVVGGALLVGACGFGREDISIAPSGRPTGGRTVVLALNSCNAHPKASVRETADEVRIRVRGRPTDADCQDTITVELDRPLGDRALIDASTGRAVPTLE